MTADLNDALGENIARNLKVYDTKYLKTIFVAVTKSSKKALPKERYRCRALESIGEWGCFGIVWI